MIEKKEVMETAVKASKNEGAMRSPIITYIYNRYGRASSTQDAIVELRISYMRKQKYISTGIRLLPKHWHNGTVTNRVDAPELNQLLDRLLVDVRKVINEMLEEGHVDIFAVPARLNRLRRGDMTFADFCLQRMKVRKYGKAKDSQERYDRFFRAFSEWGKIRYFDDVTDENVMSLDEFLTEKGMKNYSKWQNYHRFLNSFIIDAINEGLLQRNPYKHVRIEKDKSSGGIGKYLTPEEFYKIRDMELPTECLQRVRDVFVFQTYTCLSYRDLANFNAKKIQDVEGRKVYVGQRQKTKETFTVPLVSPALAILEKYDNKLPIISNVKYNAYLKVVAAHADIDKPLSTHWARHTGATLLLNAGMNLKIVAKILGHSTSRITEQIYAKLLDETVVDAMAKVEESFINLK